MKRSRIMQKLTAAVLAALSLSVSIVPFSAQAASPATGEPTGSPLPYILAVVGLLTLVLLVVVMVLEQKKKGKGQTPPTEPPAGDQTLAGPVPPADTQGESGTDQDPQ